MFTAFMVMLFVFFMALYQSNRRVKFLFAATGCIVFLTLLRSSFHIILLVPVIAASCLFAGAGWKKYLMFALLASLLSFFWYSKNLFLYDFFGSSSWAGANLWRIASATHSRTKLRNLYEDGIIEEGAGKRNVFDRPSRFVKFGYNSVSDIPLLSNDDYHNLSMLEISRMQGRSALNMIRHKPLRYAKNVWGAYLLFCKLSYDTRPLQTNKGRLYTAHLKMNEWLHGRPIMKLAGNGRMMKSSTLFVFLIPLIFLFFITKGFRECGFSIRKWMVFLTHNPVYCSALLVIAYVVLVSMFFEYGENCRFKFSIAIPVHLCFFGLLAQFLPAAGTGCRDFPVSSRNSEK